MRWEGLFDDLEAQFAAEQRRELDAEIADRTRAERARIPLIERIAASRSARISLSLVVGEGVVGRLVDFGEDWLLLREDVGREVLIPSAAIVGAVGLSDRSDPAVTARRFRLGYALRALARDRAAVTVTDRSGTQVAGTIDAVGRDWFQMSVHPVDVPRRSGAIRQRRTIPLAALVSVLSAGAQRDDEWG